MVLLLGLEIVALGAVASRLPAVRATAREAYRRVAGKGGVAPGPREGEQTQATPASASETGDVVLPASVVSPARVPRATAVAAVALPELWGIPDAAADSLLRHAVILEQLSAAVPRRHGGEAAGAWHLLWATCTHGTSLHHLLRSVASEAALLLVLRDSEGRCFGAFVPTLREPPADGTASAFYGTGEGFLFALATLTLPPLPELQLSSPTPGRRGHDEHICAYTYHWAKGRNEHFVRSDHDRLVLGSGNSGYDDEALRLSAAAALDDLQQRRVAIRGNQVNTKALRPQWSSRKAERAVSGRGGAASSVASSRAELIARRPEAGSLLRWLDARAVALDPYRRLGEVRHRAWAAPAIDATVDAVQRARIGGGGTPHVLVAQGGLGAVAAAAAAAGARVTVCEPNRYAAAAIRKVASAHGVGHAVDVAESTIEELLVKGGARSRPTVVVLAPLLEEAALGGRLLPAAQAVAEAAQRPGAAQRPPLLVPARVDVRAALYLLTAGSTHGVDLTTLDATRWTPYPMAWAAHQEEAATRLSAYEPLFGFALGGGDSSSGPSSGGNTGTGDGTSRFDSLLGCEREVSFVVSSELVAAANKASGGAGGREWTRCNAVMLDTLPNFPAHGTDCIGNRGQSPMPLPAKRAVYFVEPFIVHAGRTYTLRASHDGLRICVVPPVAAPVAPHGIADGWGVTLLQHWHFAMVRDAPRNDAYAAALERAAQSVVASCADGERRRSAEAAAIDTIAAIDLGSGSGLLALMLGRSMAHAAESEETRRGQRYVQGGTAGGHALLNKCGYVLGVEILPGVAELGKRCIDANGLGGAATIATAEGHQLCAQASQRPPHERPHAPLLIAELMDSGGLGEGLLPLAHEAVTSGLVAADAQFIPCRLRVWAFVTEMRRSGSALDGAELLPATLGGVALAPWLAYHDMKSYSSIDLPVADYAALTHEVLLFDAVLGQPPPADAILRLRAVADGIANAVLWTWEVTLDASTNPPACLSNAPRAAKTHWRQAAHLLPGAGTPLTAGQPIALRFRSITGGRELRFELHSTTVAGAVAPSRTRPHAPRHASNPPAEPIAVTAKDAVEGDGCGVDVATTTSGYRGLTSARTPPLMGSSSSSVSGLRCTRRGATRESSRARRPRAPAPQHRIAVDSSWRDAMEASTRNAIADFQLQPRGAVHSVKLCEAALEIASSPGRFGLHPWDGLQAVRLYYAS